MVGMGSLVTKSVPNFHLVIGHAARSVGYVCRCGQVLAMIANLDSNSEVRLTCAACGLDYVHNRGTITELNPPK